MSMATEYSELCWKIGAAMAVSSCSWVAVVHAQTGGVEVLRNNLQLAQTGLVMVTAIANMMLTLARGEERAESYMRDLVGIIFTVGYGIFCHFAKPGMDSGYLNLIRLRQANVTWKLSDVPFSLRVAPVRVYEVLMLTDPNSELRALLLARWLDYNFKTTAFILQVRDSGFPPRLRKGVGGSACNCLFYEVETEIEQWLADGFRSVCVIDSENDKEYVRFLCKACCIPQGRRSFLLEDEQGRLSMNGTLWVLPNSITFVDHAWLRILKDLVVLKDEVARGATGMASKQLVDQLQTPPFDLSEPTHTSKIMLGMAIESTLCLLLCGFVKIVPYLSSVICRRVVRSIVTGMTTKTAMVMPPGATLTLSCGRAHQLPVLYYNYNSSPGSDWKKAVHDWSYSLFPAGLSVATFVASHILWALSLAGYIPAIVGVHGPIHATFFNITVVGLSVSIWFAGSSWRIWKGTPCSTLGSDTGRILLLLRLVLQVLFFVLFASIFTVLVLFYLRLMDQTSIKLLNGRLWMVCTVYSFVTTVAFCLIDSIYFERYPTNNTVVDPGTTVFQLAHITSQGLLSLVTGNIF